MHVVYTECINIRYCYLYYLWCPLQCTGCPVRLIGLHSYHWELHDEGLRICSEMMKKKKRKKSVRLLLVEKFSGLWPRKQTIECRLNRSFDAANDQDRSQPHSPGWARVPLSSFFPQIAIKFSYFSSNFYSFSCSFWLSGWASRPPGKALATPLQMIDHMLEFCCAMQPCNAWSSAKFKIKYSP